MIRGPVSLFLMLALCGAAVAQAASPNRSDTSRRSRFRVSAYRRPVSAVGSSLTQGSRWSGEMDGFTRPAYTSNYNPDAAMPSSATTGYNPRATYAASYSANFTSAYNARTTFTLASTTPVMIAPAAATLPPAFTATPVRFASYPAASTLYTVTMRSMPAVASASPAMSYLSHPAPAFRRAGGGFR
jgi:hypothetical protein